MSDEHFERARKAETLLVDAFAKLAGPMGYAVRGRDFTATTDARTIASNIMAADETAVGVLRDGKHIGAVLFVFGNDGYDAIADHTDNAELARIMNRLDDIIYALEEYVHARTERHAWELLGRAESLIEWTVDHASFSS